MIFFKPHFGKIVVDAWQCFDRLEFESSRLIEKVQLKKTDGTSVVPGGVLRYIFGISESMTSISSINGNGSFE